MFLNSTLEQVSSSPPYATFVGPRFSISLTVNSSMSFPAKTSLTEVPLVWKCVRLRIFYTDLKAAVYAYAIPRSGKMFRSIISASASSNDSLSSHQGTLKTGCTCKMFLKIKGRSYHLQFANNAPIRAVIFKFSLNFYNSLSRQLVAFSFPRLPVES